MAYKLGKSKPTRIAFKFKAYTKALPTPPATAGSHTSTDTHMFLNDQLGDCVCAGAAHETIHWTSEAGASAPIVDSNVVAMYEAVAGYVPGDESTDQGTDMSVATSWRRKTGIPDSTGKRHQIAAYMSLTTKNILHLKQAIYYFGVAGVGINFPASAMDQFDAGKPWTVVSRSRIEGGHYVAAVGYDADYVYVMTWGRLQKMAWSFYTKYNDETFVYLSTENLKNGKTPEGFNLTQLQANLAAL